MAYADAHPKQQTPPAKITHTARFVRNDRRERSAASDAALIAAGSGMEITLLDERS
jgi:hypothetical protein